MKKSISDSPRSYWTYIWGLLCCSLLLLIGQVNYAQKLNVGDPTGGQKKAQQEVTNNNSDDDEIKNYKIVSEKTNDDGSVTRVVRYEKGNVMVTETTIVPPMPKIGARTPIKSDTMNLDSILIYVDKPNYLVAVIYKRKRIRQYRAVFGPNRMADKMMEGDRKTPEGWFKVVSKKTDSRWQRFILLNYPNEISYERFNKRRQEGLIPSSARIGNNIGIHGTYPTGAGMVDAGIGWTDGCVSLKPKDVEDLYNFVKAGTRVYIKGVTN